MQAKHFFSFIFYIIFFLNCAIAQSTQENLKQELAEYKQNYSVLSDEEKAKYLYDFGFKYLSINLDSSILYSDSAILFATASSATELLANTLINKATANIWSGKYTSAQKDLAEANLIAKDNNYYHVLVSAYGMYSYMFQLNEIWDQAWIYNMKMDNIVNTTKIDFPYTYGEIFDNYAVIYYGLGEYSKSNAYFEKAIATYQKDSFLDLQANCKMEYAVSLIKQSKFEKAYKNIVEANKYFSEQDEPVQISDVNEKFAQYYIATNKYDTALNYLNKSLQFYIDNALDVDEHRCRLFMAKAYAGLKNFSAAKSEALLVNDFFKERTEKHFRLDAIEILCAADKVLGVSDNAFQYVEEYMKVQAALNEQKSEMRTRELIAESNLMELQHQNDAQRQKLIILIISALCILIFTGLLFIQYRQKNKVLDHVKLLQESGQQKNAELEKINGVKDKLISMIAHDIRSPLASVQNTLSLTQDETLSPQEFKSLGKVLEGEIHHLGGMLDNLLLWARQQVTDINVSKTTFNLNELINETLALYDKNIAHKNVVIHNTINPEVHLFSDRDIIQTVFRNMLSNAIKFTNPDKSIDILLQEEDKRYLLIIKDDGMGISPDNLSKIIKKEYLSTRGTSNEKGTGLGLMFSKELLEKLGENLIIESTVNKGTTVFITISK